MKVEFTEIDRYGQKHPIETENLLSEAMKDLDAELEKLPSGRKQSYQQAVKKCPALVSEKEKLKFLRCEVFNTKLAASRMVDYWEKRLEVFGPIRAYQPLNLQSMQPDMETLATGFGRIIPVADGSGRNGIYVQPAVLDACTSPNESKLRAMWYLVHVLLEDEFTQRQGVILVSDPRNAKLTKFDLKLNEMMTASIRKILPMRMSCLHICYPPSFLRVIFPVVKYLFGARLRKRIHVHGGSVENVVSSLSKFGMDKEMMPSELGGNLILDHQNWLKQRREQGL